MTSEPKVPDTLRRMLRLNSPKKPKAGSRAEKVIAEAREHGIGVILTGKRGFPYIAYKGADVRYCSSLTAVRWAIEALSK